MHVWTRDYRIGLASTPTARCHSLESPAWVAGLTPPLACGYSSNGRPLLLLRAASTPGRSILQQIRAVLGLKSICRPAGFVPFLKRPHGELLSVSATATAFATERLAAIVIRLTAPACAFPNRH